MRSIPLMGAVLCLAVVSGCSAAQDDGDAAPTGPAASSASPTPTDSSGSESGTGSDSADPKLGPNGIGALQLGMTRQQAEATGLVEPFKKNPVSDACLWTSHLREASSKYGTVMHSETLGIAAINAYPGLKTPEGVELGSTKAEVGRAYPKWNEGDGYRGSADVPGNSKAEYRIVIEGGKVTELTLQYDKQDCYE